MGTTRLRVLLTGATGFIGSAVGRALTADVRRLRSDLTDLAALRGVCEGIDAVVHAASYVGSDPHRCEQVNHLGTQNLLTEAARSGVERVLYVSTAAVYGNGPHSRLPEEALTRAPVSPASASRAAAEDEVLAYGGTVVRPHLVYGHGDKWVVPTLTALLAVLPGWIDGGGARISMIGVHELARLIAALTATPPPPRTVYHANHPEPVMVRALGESLGRTLGIPTPRSSCPRDRLADIALPPGLRLRHLQMIAVDHWYASERIWAATGCHPHKGVLDDLESARVWYPQLAAGHDQESP